MVNVRKADGTLQPFSREKVFRTCVRLGLSHQETEEVLSEIERALYEGIPTKKVLDMVFQHGERHKPHLGHMIDLREALSLMRSKPDFEKFVALIFEHDGYKTTTNRILNGKCVDHEIDVIATKGNETLYIEVKHHGQFHTFTGLDVMLQVNSSFEDLVEGYLARAHTYNFTRPLVVLNTKISDHAKRYSACRGIGVIGWKIPENAGIEHHIDQKQMFPVTVIKGLGAETLGKLGDFGVYTLKQLVEADQRNLARETGINPGLLGDLTQKARSILGA